MLDLFLLAVFLIFMVVALSLNLHRHRCLTCGKRGAYYLHETQAGRPDRRYRHNPLICPSCEKARATRVQNAREQVRLARAISPAIKSERSINQIPIFPDGSFEGELPPLSLLDEPPPRGKGYSEETLEVLSRQVEMKLKDFRIEAHVVSAHPGPVITRFEMEPAAGVRGSQISSLDKDIARGLSVYSVRVVDVIPGKNVIGLEIPNASRETVYLSEILSSKEYGDARSPLSLALRFTVNGSITTNTGGLGSSRTALAGVVAGLKYSQAPAAAPPHARSSNNSNQ